MEVCRNCVYARYPKIPPSNPKPAKIAIVGEAPGTVELAKKRPFVGPSGDLIRKTFQVVGLPDPSEVYITNSLLCRPPAGKPIKKAGVETCRARLIAELDKVGPEVIIAFGNTPLHALTGNHKLKITKEQGRVVKDHVLPFDCKIVPVLHPAAILRDGGKYPQFVQALRKVSALVAGKSIDRPPEPTYSVVDTEDKLERAISGLIKQPYLAADFETAGHVSDLESRILCLGVCWKPGKVLIFPEEVISRLQPLFSTEGPKWIWQHGKYDIQWAHDRGLPARLDEDTMLLHYCLDENPGTHDLEQMAIRYLNDEPYKHLVDKYAGTDKEWGYANVPEDVLYRYLALDCDRTYRLFKLFWPEVTKDKELKGLYYNILLPASRFLAKVERKGMLPDPQALKEVGDELTAQMEDILAEIRKVAAPIWDGEQYVEDTGAKQVPKQFNPGSTKQLAWVLFDRLGLRPKRRKGTKGRSTDEEVLLQLQGQHEIIDWILKFRSAKKAYGTYVKGVKKRIKGDGRVHSTFNVHGTVTGRLSSSDPNIQNVPKKMRKIYHAPPGHVLVEADYKSAELRTLAYVSGDKFLSDVFKKGRDLHTEVQNALGIERIKAKTINFGIAYGRTAHSIAATFNITEQEAQKMIDDWFARAPEAHKYLTSCDKAAINGEVLTTPLGRKRRFGLVTNTNVDDLQNEARNFRIQSIASDMTLLSGIRLQPKLEQYKAHVINLVHDSTLTECPIEHKDQVVKLIVQTMMDTPWEVLNTPIPFEVDVKVGYSWGEMEEIDARPIIEERLKKMGLTS